LPDEGPVQLAVSECDCQARNPKPICIQESRERITKLRKSPAQCRREREPNARPEKQKAAGIPPAAPCLLQNYQIRVTWPAIAIEFAL
jgi:hypothetical protein